MTIELTEEQEARLAELVKTGRFDSVEQFISYLLDAVADEDAAHTN